MPTAAATTTVATATETSEIETQNKKNKQQAVSVSAAAASTYTSSSRPPPPVHYLRVTSGANVCVHPHNVHPKLLRHLCHLSSLLVPDAKRRRRPSDVGLVGAAAANARVKTNPHAVF